jgi:hypothetical protein
VFVVVQVAALRFQALVPMVQIQEYMLHTHLVIGHLEEAVEDTAFLIKKTESLVAQVAAVEAAMALQLQTAV